MVRNLESVSWLTECPILYWGDLDAQGFQILSSLRSLFPHVLSVMMDQETLSAFAEFCVAGTPGSVRQLPHLTTEEHALFVHLAERNLHLEQEHISQSYAIKRLEQIVTLSSPFTEQLSEVNGHLLQRNQPSARSDDQIQDTLGDYAKENSVRSAQE